MGEALDSSWFDETDSSDEREFPGLELGPWSVFGGEYDTDIVRISPERLKRICEDANSFPDSARQKKLTLGMVEYAVELTNPILTLYPEHANDVRSKVVDAVVRSSKFSDQQLNSRIREIAERYEHGEIPLRVALRDIIITYNLLFDDEQIDERTMTLSQGAISLLAIAECDGTHELPEPKRYQVE